MAVTVSKTTDIGVDRHDRLGYAGRMPGITNLRDLGGHETTDGRRVRTGWVFRSGQLDRTDVAAFAALGVRTVYDLRTEGERGAAPSRVPDGVAVIIAD